MKNKTKFSFILGLVVLQFVLPLWGQVFIPGAYWGAKIFPEITTGSASLGSTTGMTQIVSTNVDDGSICVNLPFSYFMSGTAYTTWCIGSNWYITAGTGSSNYSGLSASNPAIPKFHINARDNAHTQVYTYSAVNYFRIKVNGRIPYNSGAVNSYYEFFFYRPNNGKQYAMVIFGALNLTNGVCGVASASAYYATCGTISANTSYVFEGNADGTSWTVTSGSRVTGFGTDF